MLACAAATDEGLVDPRWRRTERVTIAEVEGGTTLGWKEFAVSWGTLLQSGSEPTLRARVARFPGRRGPGTVLARHVGMTRTTCSTAFPRYSHDDG
ncbi:MAG: hypothetical protein WAV54_01980 [Acidimicrobiales bacterium]